jgi:signal transduction histidine kinase/ActR/RegA family two-component response regulator
MEHRILIYAPTGRDAALVAQVLGRAGIDAHVCADAARLRTALQEGAGAVLTVHEALGSGGFAVLHDYVAAQPAWSDLPILMMTAYRAELDWPAGVGDRLGNLIMLERPVSKASLLSAAVSALRSRRRQYEAREAEARKDEFIASLSHELRNPLAPIRTAMTLLTLRHPDDADIGRVTTIVNRQVTHLTRLVDDLLDISRITNGKTELQRERVPLSAVLAHAVEICMPLLERGGHRIEVDQPETPVMLEADPARLVQSVGNVLGNACKFTIRPGVIHLSASVRDCDLTIRIRDEGIGMGPAALTQVFGLFAQEDTPYRQTLGGLGIGLNLTKRFVEMHGGSVTAHSDGIGHGSAFTLVLPVVAPADCDPAAAASAETAAAPAPVRGRILIVDDNLDGAEMLCLLLEAEGYAVATAADGLQAVEMAVGAPPDVILMDIGLPGIDGYEAARRIREAPACRGVRIVALSGWGDEKAKVRAAQAGMDGHLVKPVDAESLRRALRAGHA